jgi:hypothetical protein
MRRASFAILALVALLGGVASAQVPADYALLDGARQGQLLRAGASGAAVKALQHALAEAGYAVPDTGVFDAATTAAVKQFQAASHCGVDGVVGPETTRALDRALGASPSSSLRRLGDSEVTPAISAAAVKILHDHGADPIGTEVPFDANGKRYVGRIELHYHPPGGALKPWGYHHGVSVFEVVGAAPATPPPAPPAPATPVAWLLPRAPGARTGSDFISATSGLSRAARETEIQRELTSGNVPSFLRSFVDVTVASGGHTLTFRVLPDYLAIGSDSDFVRIPMAAPTAQRVADAWGASLPTRKMVDLIWRSAQVKVAPSPMTPGPQMMSNAYYLEHQRRVEAQLVGKPRGVLTAGHKKDLVITNLLRAHPDRVAIYGWHQLNGQAIQPLSTVHEAGYADYSHGVRLVDREVVLDGRAVQLADVLRDPALASLLSDEGAIASPRLP